MEYSLDSLNEFLNIEKTEVPIRVGESEKKAKKQENLSSNFSKKSNISKYSKPVNSHNLSYLKPL